ncbi:MAG: HDOD domain-containing protein [Acidobacteriota bacterium]|nr:HDOD domain-containing protein [Acidobacteriota bacterium]
MSPSEIVAKTGDLPTLPHVATKVMRMVSDPDTSAKDIQEAIITDQGMTGQILKISNSAMFGMKREVKTLTHAIMLLGFDTIRSIVVAAATKNLYQRKGSSGFKEKLIWENSIGSALIARGVAEQFSNIDKEEAFIGGLMHNLGKTVLNARFNEQYSQIMATAYNDERPIHEIEMEELGFSHAELGSCIIKQWNLSDSLVHAIKFYLEPEKAPKEHRMLTAIISISDRFCKDLGLGVAKPTPLEEQDLTNVRSILNLSEEKLDRWREIIHKKMEKDSAMVKTL